MSRVAILAALLLCCWPMCVLFYDFDYSAEMAPDGGADAADAQDELDGHGHGRP